MKLPAKAANDLTNQIIDLLNDYPRDVQCLAISTALADWISRHRIPGDPKATSKEWARLWKATTEGVRRMVPEIAAMTDRRKETEQ